jgi:hypothetical protein
MLIPTGNDVMVDDMVKGIVFKNEHGTNTRGIIPFLRAGGWGKRGRDEEAGFFILI